MVFGVTAGLGIAALLTQLVLTAGAIGLSSAVPVGTRLVRLVSYFTIESNVLVVVSCAVLALHPTICRHWLAAIRIDGVVGITVTGVIHLTLLRPLGSPGGVNRVTDEIFHVVIPVLAVFGWALFGPRPPMRAPFWTVLVWPAAYVGWTALHGAVSGWYPYPFVDVGLHGYPRVIATGLAILVAFAVLAAVVRLVDDRRRIRATG